MYGVSEDIAHQADADAAWREMVDDIKEETRTPTWGLDLVAVWTGFGMAPRIMSRRYLASLEGRN